MATPTVDQLQRDDGFMAAPAEQQHAYLSEVDPHYAAAHPVHQQSFLEHINNSVDETLEPNPSNYSSTARTNAYEVPKTLGRELISGVRSIAGTPSGIYHAFADEPTAEERQESGNDTEGAGKRIGLGLQRLIAQPLINAGRYYTSTAPSVDQILSVAPEALGSAGGTVLGGRVLSDLAPQSTVRPSTASEPLIRGNVPAKVAAPLSSENRAAAAYLRTQRATPAQVEVISPSGEVDPHVTNIGGRTTQSGAAPSRLIDVAAMNKLAEDTVQRHYGSSKSALLDEEPTSEPSATDVNKEAARYNKKASAQYNYEKTGGDLVNQHSVSITDKDGNPIGSIKAIATQDEPNVWRMRSSDVDPENQGVGIGSEGYRTLFEQARKTAQASGEPVTIKADASLSPQARSVWQKLAPAYKQQMLTGKRPSVTFQPYELDEDAHPLQPHVESLSNANLKQLGAKHGLDPDDYSFGRRTALREGGSKHPVERMRFVQDTIDAMSDRDRNAYMKNAESLKDEPATSSARERAIRAAKLFNNKLTN